MLTPEQARTVCDYNHGEFTTEPVNVYGCGFGSYDGKVFATLQCEKPGPCTLRLPDGTLLPAEVLQGIADTMLFIVPLPKFISFCTSRSGTLTTTPGSHRCAFKSAGLQYTVYRTPESTVVFTEKGVSSIVDARKLLGAPPVP